MTRTIEAPFPTTFSDVSMKRLGRAASTGRSMFGLSCRKDLLGPLSLSQILGPFREQVAASGLTNDELATLFAEAREEAHQQKA